MSRTNQFFCRAGMLGCSLRVALVVMTVALGLPATEARGQTEPAPPPATADAEDILKTPPTDADPPTEQNPAATPAPPPESVLVWWNRPVATFRSTTTKLPPAARMKDALERIEAAADALLEQEVSTMRAEVENDEGYRFMVGETYLFSLLKSDLDELSGESLSDARDQVLANLEGIRQARIDQGSAEAVAKGITATVIATLILVLSLLVLRFLTRKLAAGVKRLIGKWKRLRLARVDLRPHFGTLAEQIVKLSAFLLAIYLFCLWLGFSFNQFPLTAPLGHAFTSQLARFGMQLLLSALAALPGLLTAAIIILTARWASRLVNRIIRSMGRDNDAGIMAADTAKATRRIAVAVVWIFGVVLAYPHLPGSGSDAFKGISVLLGLMVSLGSSGMINQIMSSFVLLYSGSVRTGEYVKVGEIEGTVTEMGLLAVKLLTPQKEFLIVPNAVMISNPSTNYSRLAEDTGVPIHVNVTIGYDAPWRQVHEILLEAARNTGDVMDNPEPRVLQKALSDWYAEYSLTCYTGKPEGKNAVLSALNGRIQDGFNEAGIQIMSPHYFEDKPEPLIVPRDRWFPSALPRKESRPPESDQGGSAPLS